MALMPSQISSEPETFYVRELNAAQRTRVRCWAMKPLGMLESMAFWKRGRTTIFDIQICDMDAKSYGNSESKKVLESAERSM
jgi:hypothetical protein